LADDRSDPATDRRGQTAYESNLEYTDMATPKQILDRNITAINARDLDGFLSNQQPDVEFVIPGGITFLGREAVGQYMQVMWTAFPDVKLAFGRQVLGDDEAATEVVMTGTNTGPLNSPTGPIPPTGKAIKLQTLSMLRFENDRVAFEHNYFDQLDMLTQLGLAPSPSAG
jgi:predicted ester cyclase